MEQHNGRMDFVIYHKYKLLTQSCHNIQIGLGGLWKNSYHVGYLDSFAKEIRIFIRGKGAQMLADDRGVLLYIQY